MMKNGRFEWWSLEEEYGFISTSVCVRLRDGKEDGNDKE